MTRYLAERFRSEVEIGKLTVMMPKTPVLEIFRKRGRGVIAEVTGKNIVLRHKRRRDIPPLFTMKQFHFEVDLGRVFDPEKHIALTHIEQMVIVIPPRAPRHGIKPAAVSPRAPAEDQPSEEEKVLRTVLIEKVRITNSRLLILPRDPKRAPLEFHLHDVVLGSVKLQKPLRYRAKLTNPKPKGEIQSEGGFGPWNTESPGDTPLEGSYEFRNADLGVFAAIAGIMESTGKFEGTLGSIEAKGEVRVPDFRLKKFGRPVPLRVTYAALVDGTNGDTTLRPAQALLNGRTGFRVEGSVLRHEVSPKRRIDLNVSMAAGELEDLLTLAMKNKPVMAGKIDLKTLIQIPPLDAPVSDKLILDGSFAIRKGQFLRDTVQDKVDLLSRKGQGQPKNQEIDDVFSDMTGRFHMEDQAIEFQQLAFGVPGSHVELAGSYNLDEDALDFRGTLKLDAKVSQTMTGWKRWLLKPVDPFFAKNGAGTFLKIKISGPAKEPQFSASR